MTRETIYERLNAVFRDVFDDEEIAVTDATTAADIPAWDSLTHITLIAEVQDEFGVEFSMKDVVALKNVGQMADLIEREAE